jgi:hypothetical protein
MSLPSVWIIGDWQEPVFEEPIAWLRSNADCQFFETPPVANATARRGGFPEAFLLVQSRPGQFAADDVEKLHHREPLARLISLTGPWCEGEQRSGRPIAGVTRVPWRNWRQRLPIELSFSSQISPALRMATDTERIEQLVEVATSAHAERGVALISTARLETYNQIADGMQTAGFAILPYGTESGTSMSPDLIIHDGWEQASVIKNQSTGQNGQQHARRILLLHFPRPGDHILAREAGLDAVVGQPLMLADLNAALSDTIEPAA